MGPELMEHFRKQAQRFGADTRFENVDSLDLSSKPFKVTVGDTTHDDTVIIATGASARLLGLESESKLMGFEFLHAQLVMVFSIRIKKY